MKIGLDLYDTITRDPKFFKKFAEFVLAAGGQIWIVSAIGPFNNKQAHHDIRHSRVPYTGIELVVFTELHMVPSLKMAVFERLGLDMIIDDRADTCASAWVHGIAGFIC